MNSSHVFNKKKVLAVYDLLIGFFFYVLASRFCMRMLNYFVRLLNQKDHFHSSHFSMFFSLAFDIMKKTMNRNNSFLKEKRPKIEKARTTNKRRTNTIINIYILFVRFVKFSNHPVIYDLGY
jgi:hypothetical protein